MYDEEIEKTVLYYVIFEKEELNLSEKDFFLQKNKQIFTAIQELKAKKEEINLLSIKQKIKSESKEILKYLTDLADFVYGTSINYAYKELKRLSKKRELLRISKEIMKKVNAKEEIEVYIEQIIKELGDINQEGEKEKSFLEMLIETSDLIDKKIKEGSKFDNKYLTGIFDLDKATNGLHEEEFTVIGARPRNGEKYICITDSLQCSKQRCTCRNSKLGNVCNTDNTKNNL